MRPISRIKKLEAAVACEACELRDRLVRTLGELSTAWGLKAAPGVVRAVRCDFCGARKDVYLSGMTPDEIADMMRAEELYWRGEMCSPEFAQAQERALAGLGRALREFWGEHFAEVEPYREEYREALNAIRQMPVPYLCRVPGCACEYPKTLERWKANCKANGYEVAA